MQLTTRGIVRRRLPILGVTITAVSFALWFQWWSLDGFPGVLLTALLREDTSYASGYTDRGFRTIRAGMRAERVQTLVGLPLSVSWSYESSSSLCRSVNFVNGRVRSWAFADCENVGLQTGMPMDRASVVLGRPHEIYWLYSELSLIHI